MFYSQFILAKKGPLGTIWIAAHLERKLRKNQVADTDIGHSVDSILFPDMPIALRLSSHLLLGVVRIYSRKVNYLFDDCSEALLKVKQAFRSTAVDLPPEESTAPYHSITLPETFDLDDFELPDNDLLEGNFMDHHVSTREQITLQDTMDGTAYSTSQFGLDERFGDGDASQIGLDLEEELISEKAVGPVQYMDLDSGPQASTEPTALSKDGEDIRDIIDASEHLLDRDKNKIEDLASNAEYMDYAHTPYTPGLVEEPMGENIARDNHLGEEDQVFKESLDIENVENVCGKLDFDQVEKDAASMSHQNDTNQDTVDSKSLDENGHFSHEVENPDNLELSSNTFALNGDDSVKDFPDRVINNEKIMCSSVSTAPKEIEPSLDDSRQQGSSCDSKHDQGSGQPEGPPDAEVSANPEFACIPGRLLVAADDTCAVESLNKPECASDDLSSQGLNIVTSSNNVDQGGTPSVSMQLLRPCNSHPREGGALSDGMATLEDGQDSRVTDIMKPARKETHLTEPNLIEVQPHNNSAGQVVNAISHDNQSGNLNTSGPSALPAPEKLLSVPDVLADKPNDLLLSSIPNKEGLEGDDSTQITGKKRSFTESTLTVQSLTSEESFRDSRSKRTVESMPDDDDVLSSILVGRRSLGLNLKSTPSAPEVPSSKRLKSAQRPSTIKRKVLMDDAMVLHGDTIRQQLVSTEDIRRIRKKAPCTRPEILLIQRQFFEDGMLNETIFSGMSVELNCLYCEAYDLSKIRICENAENNSSSEFQKTAESSVRPTAPEEIDNEGRNEVPSLENNVEVQSKDLDMVSNNVSATMAVVTEAENLHDQMLDSAVGMEVERVSVAVNAEDHSAGLDSSFTPYIASGEHKPEEHVGLNLTGAECVSTDRKFNTQVNEHASAADTASEKVFDAINGAVDNASTHLEGGSEYEPCKCIELDENIDGSSIDVRVNNQKDVSSLGVMNNSNTIAPPETGSCDKQVSINGDRIVDLSEKGLDNANKDNHFMEFPCKDKSPTSSLMHEQEPNASSHVKNRECQVTDEADVHDGMDAESTAIYQPVGEFHDDLENIRVENDTGFLNEDDAEVADEGDALPTSEDLENSGWSARTRAVAKYLQNAFDKEALHGRKVLSVDNLLSGKTRKEASRMFFETLVLKTRDYIHLEQAKPLDNIVLKPRVKLMKSEF